jgi:DNA-binding transcriptional ArsR family regulator
MDNVLLAISDPSRRTMLEELRRGPATVNELASTVSIARPGVSRHLRVLREAGLVAVQKDAQRRLYSLQPGPLVEVDAWLSNYRAIWEQRMDALHTEVARGQRAQRHDNQGSTK